MPPHLAGALNKQLHHAVGFQAVGQFAMRVAEPWQVKQPLAGQRLHRRSEDDSGLHEAARVDVRRVGGQRGVQRARLGI